MKRAFLLLSVLFTVLAARAVQLLPQWGDSFWRDSIPETMRQSYIAFGEQYLKKDWYSLPASAFAEFKKTGNRTHYESLMFEKRRQLAALVMAELIEGQYRFMPDIINGLQSTLEETWWGLPAHYKTEVPRTEDQTVDLFNAETAALIAYTRHVLSDEIGHFSSLLVQRIDQEISRRILQPALTAKYWWKTAGMNWNPWICSNWLACVLFCEHDDQRRQASLDQIVKACEAFMAAYPADGGCDEGPHYWDRAAASLFETLYLLQANTQHPAPGTHHPKLLAMESYIYKMYIGNGYAVNFADAHGNRAMLNINIGYPFGLMTSDKTMCQYAAWVGQQEDVLHQAAQLYNKSGNWPSLGRELIFLKHIQAFLREEPREPQLNEVWLPDLQIMTTREPFVAMKGGHNGESHNHNDVGSFIIYPNGTPLLIDPGVGEYTSKTFSGQRYDIWTMQSDYHNLPRINGYSQHDGKQYKAHVISHKTGQLTLDISSVYPAEAQIQQWLRTVKVQKGKSVEITEDFALKAYQAPTQLMLITTIEPQLTKAGIMTLGSHTINYNAKQLTPEVEDLTPLLDPTLRQMWGTHLYRIKMTLCSHNLKQSIRYVIK